jgi:hypothetical protein
MRRSSLFLALALAACACKGESAAAPPSTNVFISVANDGEGARPPEGFRGTWVDIVAGVEFRQTLVMATGATTTNESRINGHPFSVEGEHVVIGPKRYGPLAAETYVEIRNEGVFADGKLLGPLPGHIPMPPDEE